MMQLTRRRMVDTTVKKVEELMVKILFIKI
jgi:hypothetical protein